MGYSHRKGGSPCVIISRVSSLTDFNKIRVSSPENDFISQEYKEMGPRNNLMTFIWTNSVAMWL